MKKFQNPEPKVFTNKDRMTQILAELKLFRAPITD